MPGRRAENLLEQQRWGAALKVLRTRSGRTQLEAGERADISSQGWSLYETGKMSGIFQPEQQARLAEAVDSTREELSRVFEQLRRGDPSEDLGAIPFSLAEAEPPPYEVGASTRIRVDDQHRIAFDLRRHDARIDFRWLFGPDAGVVRMAGSHLKGRVETGDLLIFDRSLWPKPGQICLIELTNGSTYVYIFQGQEGGVIAAAQTEPAAAVEFPIGVVKGVYAVRLTGD